MVLPALVDLSEVVVPYKVIEGLYPDCINFVLNLPVNTRYNTVYYVLFRVLLQIDVGKIRLIVHFGLELLLQVDLGGIKVPSILGIVVNYLFGQLTDGADNSLFQV